VLVQASSDFLKKREKDAATMNALQNLSRELQDQNRKIKAEVVKKTQEDDNQRRALIEKFQGSLESISKQLGKKNVKKIVKKCLKMSKCRKMSKLSHFSIFITFDILTFT
jgi:methionyl-tRNA synthetase